MPMEPAPKEGVAPEPNAGPEAFLGAEAEPEPLLLLSRGAVESAPWKTFLGAPLARTTLASAEEARRRAEAARAAASCLADEEAEGATGSFLFLVVVAGEAWRKRERVRTREKREVHGQPKSEGLAIAFVSNFHLLRLLLLRTKCHPLSVSASRACKIACS